MELRNSSKIEPLLHQLPNDKILDKHLGMVTIKQIGFVELIEIGNGCFDVIIIRVRKKRRNGIYLHVWMAADGHCSKFLPDSFLNSSSISSLPLDFGIFPINKRVLGSLTFTFKIFPSPISYESSCRTKIIIVVTTCKGSFIL